MLGLAAAVITATVAGVVLHDFFFGDSSSTSSSRPAATTSPSPPSPPPASSSSQTYARGSAVNSCSCCVYNPPRSSFAPTQVSDSRRTFASTYAQAASPQPPTYARVARATTQTQADLAILDQSQYVYDSDLAPPRARESRQSQTFPPSAHTSVSYTSQTTATRISQTTVSASTTTGRRDGVHRSGRPPPYPGESRQYIQSPYSIQQTSTFISRNTTSTSTAAGHSDGIHRSALDSPYAGESHRTLPTSARSQAFISCQYAPSPDVAPYTVLTSPVSPLTKSRTRPSKHPSDLLPDILSSFEFDVATNIENMKIARDLRVKAQRSNREMIEARDLAKSARKRGDYEAQYTYNRQAISHESEMKSYNKKAARIIFKENNKAHNEGMVDLHGLFVKEAMEYAKAELESATYRDDISVCFIVGKGLHGDGGRSKLRPALEDLCAERELICSVDPENTGRFIVYLC
ncbi:hypothetical protein BJV74DRAFT_824920 [Russula compacta]|nr:hypothetical protein BJV74DRAFT_824920 [Russula compacta]